MMRTLELPAGDGRTRGRAHGEAYRGEIASLAEIRLYLCGQISGGTREQILDLARLHLPILADYDRDLHDELVGIAEGANLDPALVLTLNHYTDLRDLKIGAGNAAGTTDGCSVVWAQTPEGSIAAQTWDMHATSLPYVMMMRAPEHGDVPAMWVLTLTGCLGMTGLSERGVALCVNNLPSTDAVHGPVWSAVVRHALAAPTAVAARNLLLETRHGSGRHFLVADRKSAFGVETSGTIRHMVFTTATPGESPTSYVHTNHCLDPEIEACTAIAPGATTFDRYRVLKDRLDRQPLAGADDAWDLIGSVEGYPRSVSSNMVTPDNPHGSATCAGIVMRPASGELLACAGFTHLARPSRFSF